MKPKHLKLWLLLFIMEDLLAGISLFSMRFDINRGHTLNYGTLRLVLAGLGGLGLLSAFIFLVYLYWKPNSAFNFSMALDRKIRGPVERLLTIQFFIGLATVFISEMVLMSYISIPEPFRPFLGLGWLCLLHSWIFLRLLYRDLYHKKASLQTLLRNRWQNSLPVQRQVVMILLVISLIYFAAFIPINLSSKPTDGRPYFGHSDEIVIYFSVIKVLTPGANLTASINNLLIDNNWWYGYPYLPISAATLIIPRIVFGTSFGEHVQLNLLLLRQFVNILPMLLALALLVYLVTRFKNRLYAVGMFLFLLFVPGIFNFNYRFWHPDSIILLLIVLTFYFLERDQLRFRRYFSLAAVTCGLAAVIKLWGFFFFLVIAGYLLAGFYKKILSFKYMLVAGIGFIAVMAFTMLISSPSFMYPATVKSLVNDWGHQLSTNATGYNEPDPEGVYRTGLNNWLQYFDLFYMRPWFFFFAWAALILGSLWGKQTYLNRLFLGWCLVTGIYLVYFVAVKSYQYMMPLMLPLYASGFMFPALAIEKSQPTRLATLFKRFSPWVVLLVLVVIQYAMNIKTILNQP